MKILQYPVSVYETWAKMPKDSKEYQNLQNLLEWLRADVVAASVFFFALRNPDGTFDLEGTRGNLMVPRFGIPDIHLEVMDTMAKRRRLNLLILPREHGKTTLLQMFAMVSIIFRYARYLQVFSESLEQAKLWMDTLMFHFTHNEYIRLVAGNLKPVKDEGIERWSSKFLITSRGDAVEIMGWGQKPRGRKFRDMRPDMQILDDFESEDNTNTEELRKKVRRFIFRKILPAIDELHGQQIFTGTIVHPDAFLQRTYNIVQIALDKGEVPNWECVYAAVEKNGEMIWAERYTRKWLEWKKSVYEEQDELDSFYQEYYHQAVSEKSRVFKQHIRFWEGHLEWRRNMPWVTGKIYKRRRPEMAIAGSTADLEEIGNFEAPVYLFGGMDIGFTSKELSDFTAMTVIATDEFENTFEIETDAGAWDYGQILENLSEMQTIYKPLSWTTESNGAQELVQAAMKRELHRFSFGFITNHEHVPKLKRIERMIPRAKRGKLYLRLSSPLTIEDMDNYPKPRRFDRLDALEKATRNSYPGPHYESVATPETDEDGDVIDYVEETEGYMVQ